jgi:hypothetical protein
MHAQTDTTAPSPSAPAARPTRATLRTRPRIQRILIRSWEYIQPVRVTILALRLLGVLSLVVIGAVLMSEGNAWGVTLPLAALAMFAFSAWLFSTAAKGWPAVER